MSHGSVGRRAALAAPIAAIALRGAIAQEASRAGLPSRPLRLIVPWAPGGLTDLSARAIAELAGRRLGRPVVVENRVGASGTVGTMEVVRAAPDGYTLLAVSASPIVITPAVQHVAYDPRRDFTFIANYAGAFDGILVPARSPWRSLDDLIVAARATPDTLTYATSGVNGAGHPAVMVLAQRAALRMEHIPYTGGAPVLTALLSAQVSFAVLSNFSEQVHRGDFRLLAVIQDERMPEFPDVPALAERSGALATPHVMGIAAPAGLPAAERATLTAAFVDAANSSEFATRLERLGMPLRVRDGVAMQRQILESFDRYRAAVRELTLRAT